MFPDLRVHRVGVREEGFWPSFTDIMMVIVMIFLMAMLGLLLRNMDLVGKLQAALHEAQQAAQKIKRTSSANQDLSSRLAQREHDLEMMRAQLMDVSAQRKAVEARLAAAQQAEASWRQKAEQLRRNYQQLQGEKQSLDDTLTTLRAQLEQNRLAAEAQSRQAAEQLKQARQQLQQQGVDLVKLRAALAEQDTANRLLRDDYSELAAKYQRLIRPARSSLGKVVVTVRYLRRDGKLKIAIQPPDSKGFIDVDSVRLHQMLSQLKQKLGRKLYVRILFPRDSGLSYNEAWRITESLLRLYDYYYQE